MTKGPEALKRCPICWKSKKMIDIITLPCNHFVCGLCLQNYEGEFCPEVECAGGRSTEIVVDEISGGEALLRMKFGMNALSMLKLDERMHCDNIRNQMACNNIARVKLNHCRHNICNDCLGPQIQATLTTNSIPHCPVMYCANSLTSIDLRQWAELSPLNQPIVAQVESRLPKAVEMNALARALALGNTYCPFHSSLFQPPNHREINVGVYGQEMSYRRIIVPDNCHVLDMLIAISHMQRRFLNGKSINDLGFYIREEQKVGASYDRLLPRFMTKTCIVKNMQWPQKVSIVVDVDGEIFSTGKK